MADQKVVLYKYMSTEYAVEAIKKQRLFLNDGKSFNDPFELTIIQKDSSISRIDDLHILCLTGGYSNKLIWSHYTNSHKGICLTVSVPKKWVVPVCYTGKRVAFDTDIESQIKKALKHNNNKYNAKKCSDDPYAMLDKNKKIACIKDQKWAYEREYRLIFNSADVKNPDVGIQIEHKALHFFPVKITNVYLGVKFWENTEDVQKDIVDACKSIGATIKCMQLSTKDYSVHPSKDDVKARYK